VIKSSTLVGVEFSLVHSKDGRKSCWATRKTLGNATSSGAYGPLLTRAGGQSPRWRVSRCAMRGWASMTGDRPADDIIARQAGAALQERDDGTSFDADVTLSGRTAHVTPI